jgi:hypothetical protein
LPDLTVSQFYADGAERLKFDAPNRRA